MAKGIRTDNKRQTVASQLPDGWEVKHSKTRNGRIYYFNCTTGMSTWKRPSSALKQEGSGKQEVKEAPLEHKKKKLPPEKMPSALSMIAMHYKQQEDSAPTNISPLSRKRKLETNSTMFSSPAKATKSSTVPSSRKIFVSDSQKSCLIQTDDKSCGKLKKLIMDNSSSETLKGLEYKPSKNNTKTLSILLQGGKAAKETFNSTPMDARKATAKRKLPKNFLDDIAKAVPKRKVTTARRRNKGNIPLTVDSLSKISNITVEELAKINKEQTPAIKNKMNINSKAVSVTSFDGYDIKENRRKTCESAKNLVDKSTRSSHRNITVGMSLLEPDAKTIEDDYNCDPLFYDSLFQSQPSQNNNSSLITKENSSLESHTCISNTSPSHMCRSNPFIRNVCISNSRPRHTCISSTRISNTSPSNIVTSSASKTVTDPVIRCLKLKNNSDHITSKDPLRWNNSTGNQSSMGCKKTGSSFSPSRTNTDILNPEDSNYKNKKSEVGNFDFAHNLNNMNSEDDRLSNIYSDDDKLADNLSNTTDDIEDMEVDEDTILLLSNLQDVRQQTSSVADEPKGVLTETISMTASSIQLKVNNSEMCDASEPQVILVVDTNILISCLGFLKDILPYKVPGYSGVILVLPWVVMQELDYLKNGKGFTNKLEDSLSKSAAKAVGFIHHHLINKSPQLIGQTPTASREETDLRIQCNDDRILQCCKQFERKHPNSRVILLTRDVNLINKAMIMGISAEIDKTLLSRLKVSKSCLSKRQVSTEDNIPPSDTSNGRIIPLIDSDYSSHTKLHAQAMDNTTFMTETGFITAYNDSQPVLSSHSDITSGPSTSEKHLPVGNTHPTSAKMFIEQDTTPQTDTEKAVVMNKFEAVWKLIYEIKSQIGAVLVEGKSHANYNEAVQMLQVIIPLLSLLKEDYSRCLSLSPVILWEHESDFSTLCSHLNTFFQQAHTSCIDPSQPIETKQLIKHFYTTGNRPTLLVGLEQLNSLVTDIEEMLKMCS